MKDGDTDDRSDAAEQSIEQTQSSTLLFTIQSSQAGDRLDSVLASQIRDLSRTRLKYAIEGGDVLVNEQTSKPSYKVRVGDRIEVELSEPPPVDLRPEPISLDIVFEDSDLIVINKPAGMVVHPGAGINTGTLANGLVYHFEALSGSGGPIRPGIVHRIDKDTSGLLVVAKNDWIHDRLSRQFADRQVFKLYVALVIGQLKSDRGEIESLIGRSAHHRTRMAVVRSGGRPAYTIYEVEGRFEEFTLLRVQIKTGRTHQIRVHLSSIGHPVAGDSTYGGGRENSLKSATRHQIARLNRQFLHASELSFVHPRSEQTLKFSAELPAELKSFLEYVSSESSR